MSKTTITERTNISSGGAYEAIFGYSRAVRAGNDVHVSGTCAPVAHEKSNAYAQARAALEIIEKALGEAGAGLQRRRSDRRLSPRHQRCRGCCPRPPRILRQGSPREHPGAGDFHAAPVAEGRDRGLCEACLRGVSRNAVQSCADAGARQLSDVRNQCILVGGPRSGRMQTLKLIAQATRQEFPECGYAATTKSAVAARAGTSPKTKATPAVLVGGVGNSVVDTRGRRRDSVVRVVTIA